MSRLLDEHVRFTCERIPSGSANTTPKLTSIIAGMAAGADSIDDLDVIRAGGMTKLFDRVYAASTLGILLREFTYGHNRQLSTVLRRHLVALTEQTHALDGITDRCFIDIDSLLRPVDGRAKQGASFGQRKSPARPCYGVACHPWPSRSAPRPPRRCWPGSGYGPDAPPRHEARRA